MKYTPYITILTVLLAAACAKQETVGEQQPVLPENAVSFSGTVSRGDSPMDASPDTKTIYEDMTEKLAVTWAEGDEVGIFCETGKENASVASNYGYRTAAAGATSAFVPMDSYNQVITWADMTTAHDFYAYYPYSPAQEGSTVDRRKVPVSLPSVQTFDASDPLGHLSDIDFMYASAVDRTADGGMVTFDFSYLFSVLEVRLATSMYATVDAIELSCTEDAEAVAFEGATVDIETGALDMTGASVSSTIRLEGSKETSIGEYVSFFMLISPGHVGKTFDITAEIGGTPYTVVLGKAAPEDGFAAGKTYVIDAGLVDVAPADATPITDLSAGGTANCYYVTAANTLYSFDATVKGNGQALTLGEMSYSEDDLKIAPQSILVLWYTCLQSGIPWVQECPILMESVILSEGKAYFKTPDTFIPGNVVLIALDADLDYEDVTVDDLRQINNANVLWSWNLVVTEGYDPAAASNQYNKAGYTFMTRDLGAVIDPEDAEGNMFNMGSTMGNGYQWGRKDPFPGLPDYMSDRNNYSALHYNPAYTPIPALNIGTVDGTADRDAHNQIFSPTTICYSGSITAQSESFVSVTTRSPYLFYGYSGTLDESGHSLWGNPSQADPLGEKTIYDPCPPGYKVMSLAAWNALTDNMTATDAIVAQECCGLWVDGKAYFAFTGAKGYRYINGQVDWGGGNTIAASGKSNVFAAYWVDSSWDAQLVWFDASKLAAGGAAVQGYGYANDRQSARPTSIRCIKINPGTAVPGGELDNFDKKDW